MAWLIAIELNESFQEGQCEIHTLYNQILDTLHTEMDSKLYIARSKEKRDKAA